MEVYLIRDGQQSGPHTAEEVQIMVAAQDIDRACLAWREGLPGWLPLEEVVTLPTRAPWSQPPAGLPPVPVRRPAGLDWKTGVSQLNEHLENFDATKLGSAGKRHLPKILPIIGGILLVLMNWQCHH